MLPAGPAFIGLSITAVATFGVRVCGGIVLNALGAPITLGSALATLGSASVTLGSGLMSWKVTFFLFSGALQIACNRCSALICSFPRMFFLFSSAWVASPNALTTLSSCVTVGLVMYLCWKNTVRYSFAASSFHKYNMASIMLIGCS